jgi:hypothetical protein
MRDHFLSSLRLFFTAVLVLATSMSYAESTADVVCSYAPSQSAAVNRITSYLGGAEAGAAALLKATGQKFVPHSGGGYILTSSRGGYVAATLLRPLVFPTLVTAAVVVGSATIVVVLACAPRNHPEAIDSVNRITKEFNQAVREANANAVEVRDATTRKIQELNENGIVLRDRTLSEIKRANSRGIEIRDKATEYFAGVF